MREKEINRILQQKKERKQKVSYLLEGGGGQALELINSLRIIIHLQILKAQKKLLISLYSYNPWGKGQIEGDITLIHLLNKGIIAYLGTSYDTSI